MENTIGGKKFHIQWFPGHMTKAKRMMEANLKLVDVVVELLDARIPRSSANPMLQQLIGSKQKIVVLNKTDMADPDRTRDWLDDFIWGMFGSYQEHKCGCNPYFQIAL